MQALPSATKYGFRIRTRNGAVVDKLSICGRDENDAERKLRQIYLGCEIIESKRMVVPMQRSSPVTYEDVVDLISGGSDASSAD